MRRLPILAKGEYVKTPSKLHNAVEIDGFDLPVILPERPRREDMVNYGKPIEDQKFRRTVLPENWADLDFHEQEAIAAREWHRRIHGMWWIIKEHEVYIPGSCYFFLNYWITENGTLPDFRIEAVEFFQIWDMAEQDPQCYGLLDVKARRLGDTEKALCAGYEIVTRYRFQWFGMQNITEEDAKQNFDRVVNAYRSMHPIFRPVSESSEAPKRELIFRYPPQSGESAKQNAGRIASHVGSRINYESTKLKKYDGKSLAFYHGDEVFKISPTEMPIDEQWNIVRLCLSLNNGKIINGKAILSSTVENIAGGRTIELARKMVGESMPRDINENGRTTTGLWLLFRNYKKGAEVDEWGFHKVEEATIHRDAEIKNLMKRGDLDALSSLKRKMPDTIDDALAMPAEDCILFPALLDHQMDLLRVKTESGESVAQRGDLVWKKGFGSDVSFIPNPTGRWEFSQFPAMANNRSFIGGKFTPGNTADYAIGIDPIDHAKPSKGGSLAAIAVYRIYNPLEEPPNIYDEKGEIIDVSGMVTDQFVATYAHRAARPEEFYEDAAKTCIFLGAQAFIERDKPGIIRYFQEHQLSAYLAMRPHDLKTTGAHMRDDVPGAKASTPLIGAYIEALKTHVAGRLQTYKHLSLLQDYRMFTGENRSERDLTVAAGFALLLGRKVDRVRKVNANKRWSNMPFKIYDKHGKPISV